MGYLRFRPEHASLPQETRDTATGPGSVAGAATVAGCKTADPTMPWNRWRGATPAIRFEKQVPPVPAGSVTPATPATLATDRGQIHLNVATVASVADLTKAAAILAAYRRLIARDGRRPAGASIRVVEQFLSDLWATACRFGWSDADLFGCHRDPSFAHVRYDCMGAVTAAALAATPIVLVCETEIRGRDGLASRRPTTNELAQPVWVTFSPDL